MTTALDLLARARFEERLKPRSAPDSAPRTREQSILEHQGVIQLDARFRAVRLNAECSRSIVD